MEEIKNMKLPKALVEELRKAEQRSTISWESSNEGVHERVNFDDTIWGLSLAGGAFYNTPLRVTQVKEGSRAEHAGIKVGDYLTSINDIDSTTLTIQEAHDMILESGLQIKFALSA
ncbi:PDZ and LIM domain protein 7-like [Cydia splendana]